MNIRTLALIIGSGLVALSARADYSYKEPFTKTAPFHGDGVLALENVNGSVDIRSWDRNEIKIDGEKSARTEEELNQIELTMEVSDAHAHLKVHLPKRTGSWFGGSTIRAAVRFTIMLPAGASIDRVEVVNSSVKIEGIKGDVEIHTVNGSIQAHGLAGDARLKTVNGSISAAFASVSPHQNLDFETVNGSITARVPADTGASVRAKTVNGHISTDFPLTISGRFVGRHLDGTIGNGGAAIQAQTVNGGIKLERS